MSINYFSEKEAGFWQQDAFNYLDGMMRGLEKESLRVMPDGRISNRPHPKALGSALTHQYITTDYSEALMEFITPPSTVLNEPVQSLTRIHQEVYQHLNNEVLWATSMPCVMGEETDIPIAYYGSSNSGRMKYVYREGLGHRYGRFMQTIAGVHYNVSFPEALWDALYELSDKSLDRDHFKSERYMGVIRNFLRNGWIVPLLFGASPALCESFLKGRTTRLKTLIPGTVYEPNATSLRMSDLGYQNNVQSRLKVSYNRLSEYVSDLEQAIRTPDPYYQSLGVVVDGVYRQLNANVLQIENEFYSNIRPKRTTQSGERPSKALSSRGVEYLEIRTLDLNPFSAIGVTQEQLNFLDVFLLHCLMQSSCPITVREEAEFRKNFQRVVKGGRDPEMYLLKDNHEVLLRQEAKSLLQSLIELSSILDKAYGVEDFSQTLVGLSSWVEDPDRTPSGRIVKTILERQDGFFPFAIELSNQYAKEFRGMKRDDVLHNKFAEEAKRSLQKQSEIERKDNKSFEAFLADYYA